MKHDNKRNNILTTLLTLFLLLTNFNHCGNKDGGSEAQPKTIEDVCNDFSEAYVSCGESALDCENFEQDFDEADKACEKENITYSDCLVASSCEDLLAETSCDDEFGEFLQCKTEYSNPNTTLEETNESCNNVLVLGCNLNFECGFEENTIYHICLKESKAWYDCLSVSSCQEIENETSCLAESQAITDCGNAFNL